VRTDDPRLEAARKAMAERVEKFNALMLATIKGHLLIEQTINEFLEASLSNATHISGARFGFANKTRLCRAVSFDQSEDQLWTIIGCINGLRNAIAHGDSEDKIAKALRTLKSELLAYLTPEQAAGLKEQPDDRIVEAACFTCAARLVTLTGEAKERRKLLDEHSRPDDAEV
jgi:hypothetical protein